MIRSTKTLLDVRQALRNSKTAKLIRIHGRRSTELAAAGESYKRRPGRESYTHTLGSENESHDERDQTYRRERTPDMIYRTEGPRDASPRRERRRDRGRSHTSRTRDASRTHQHGGSSSRQRRRYHRGDRGGASFKQAWKRITKHRRSLTQS